ncbi:hypothetical protein DFH08DRAFT_977836 [Mycena albidolilacea]|uniref:Uncharacterized protein n=1 Tax=Mycena albidolilacea TaxID=1033008 RepID=A0AAD6YZT9_9AGAR|nr:hypothetical protein DFH08DRAFT_977836 [Mycena albidolilacea]
MVRAFTLFFRDISADLRLFCPTLRSPSPLLHSSSFLRPNRSSLHRIPLPSPTIDYSPSPSRVPSSIHRSLHLPLHALPSHLTPCNPSPALSLSLTPSCFLMHLPVPATLRPSSASLPPLLPSLLLASIFRLPLAASLASSTSFLLPLLLPASSLFVASRPSLSPCLAFPSSPSPLRLPLFGSLVSSHLPRYPPRVRRLPFPFPHLLRLSFASSHPR